MASVKKFSRRASYAQLRHIYREDKNPSNKDIDPARTHLNYDLTPERDCTPREYFDRRLASVHVHQRSDIKTLFGWVITLPADMPESSERPFFEACVAFLSRRYGAANLVAAVVHKDEAGQPHIHTLIMPVVYDDKHVQGAKLCASQVLTRRELQRFHGALQTFLTYGAKINCSVNAGNTGAGWSVSEAKRARERVMEMFGGSPSEWEVLR